MKKSFLYFVPAALILALLFAGCPQEADDDDGGSSSGLDGSYGSDLGSIARAFADADGAAKTVYVTDNVHIGDGELIVPPNGTLDLTDKVTIDQIGYNAKLVVAGKINLSTDRIYQIRWDSVPSAKIITNTQFITDNIEFVEDKTDTTPYTKPIVASKAQVLNFITASSSELSTASWWENTITNLNAQTGGIGNSDLIPIVYAGDIGQTIADNLNMYGSGRKVYIIGNVTLNAQIELVGITKWTPPQPQPEPDEPDGPNALFNVIDDAPGSLVIGGQVKFDGVSSSVSTTGGFTALGPLVTVNDRRSSPVNTGGLVIAYTVRAESGGAGFVGPVNLIGSQPSNFGVSTTFENSFETRGISIFGGVTFGGSAILNGPVEFASDQVTVKSSLLLNGPVTFTTGSVPNAIVENPSSFGSGVTLLTFVTDYARSDASTPLTFSVPVQFDKKATFGTQAIFNKGVTFNDDASFSGGIALFTGSEVLFRKSASFVANASGSYSADSVTFEKAVSLGNNMIPEIKSSQVIFKESVTFGTVGVSFTGPVVFGGAVSGLEGDTDFRGGASFAGAVDFPQGRNLTFGKALSFNGGKIILGVETESGTVTVPADYPLSIKDGNLTVAGTLTVGSASIDISGGGTIILGTKDGTAILFGTNGANVAVTTANIGVIKTKNYTITGGTVAGGTLVGLVGTGQATTDTIVLHNESISLGAGNSGSQATLIFAGTYNAANQIGAPTLTATGNIVVDGITLDLSGETFTAGTAAGTVTANTTGQVVITLKGTGSVNPTGGSLVTGGKAGAVRVGGTVLVFGNQVESYGGNTAKAVSDGYIVFTVNGFAEGTNSLSYTNSIVGTTGVGGSISQLKVNGGQKYITLVGGSLDAGFVTAGSSTFYPIYNAQDAIGIVTSSGGNQKYATVSNTGGSIAVLTGSVKTE